MYPIEIGTRLAGALPFSWCTFPSLYESHTDYENGIKERQLQMLRAYPYDATDILMLCPFFAPMQMTFVLIL